MNIHGGDIYGGDIYDGDKVKERAVLDLSASISPLGIPEGVVSAMMEALGSSHRYPDIYCRKLRQALSVYEGRPAENIVCGNGATELIYNIVRALQPKRALLFAPTFSEYERALSRAECHITVYTSASLRLDRGFIDFIDRGTDMVFLCNPNNPTGYLTDRSLMCEIVKKCEECDTYLCVDECFLDFVEEGEKYSVKNLPGDHIICLKAFTKIFALAGVRLGYALTGSKETAERIFDAGYPWSVSNIAQTAGIACTYERDHILRVRQLVKTEREYLTKQLRSVGFQVFEGSAGYLLFRAGRGLGDALKEKGILIRNCSDFRGLGDTFYRTGVRCHEDNERFVEALFEVIPEFEQ